MSPLCLRFYTQKPCNRFTFYYYYFFFDKTLKKKNFGLFSIIYSVHVCVNSVLVLQYFWSPNVRVHFQAALVCPDFLISFIDILLRYNYIDELRIFFTFFLTYKILILFAFFFVSILVFTRHIFSQNDFSVNFIFANTFYEVVLITRF